MSGTQLSGDTRYLFRRDKTWWVKLAVPRQLRDSLGYDLRRSLRTRDLNEARQARWEAIEEFRSKIDKAKAAQAAASSGAAATAAVEGDDVARSADGPQRIGEHIVEIVSDSADATPLPSRTAAEAATRKNLRMRHPPKIYGHRLYRKSPS